MYCDDIRNRVQQDGEDGGDSYNPSIISLTIFMLNKMIVSFKHRGIAKDDNDYRGEVIHKCIANEDKDTSQDNIMSVLLYEIGLLCKMYSQSSSSFPSKKSMFWSFDEQLD